MNAVEVVKNIAKAVEQATYRDVFPLSSFGIRIMTPDHNGKVVVNVGDDLPCSINTCDDSEFEELDGTCSLSLNELLPYDVEDEEEVQKCAAKLEEMIALLHKNYGDSDDQIVIIGGNNSEYGNDDNELVIENAEVVYII